MAKTKNFIIAVFLLILVFSISACGKKDSAGSSKENVRTGTQAILMNFLPNNPPDKIHAESDSARNQFDVVLELRNQGAYPKPEDLSLIGGFGGPKGRLYLSGYDPYIITLVPKAPKSGQSATGADLNQLALDGKSTINPNGGQDILAFQGTVDYSKLRVDKYDVILLATACYQYQTVVGPTVCIDPDPYTTVNQKKVCQVKDTALSSQGAPVAITSINEEAFDQKTQFKITIKNVGGGEVVKKESLDKCDPYGKSSTAAGSSNSNKIARDDLDKVYVDFVNIADRPITCGPFADGTVKGTSGLLRMINGEGFIICELQKGKGEYSQTNTAYTTPMVIHLSYGYRTTIQRNIQVIREPPSSGSSPQPEAPTSLPESPSTYVPGTLRA